MSEIANASINTFGTTSPKADFVSTSEDQRITVPASLLQGLQDRIDALEDRIVQQDEKLAALEATQDTLGENDLNQLRLIADLRKGRAPQPLQRDRREILRALLAVNGGKMLAKKARQQMHMPKNKFSELLAVCDFVTLKPYHLDNRQRVIILKSELVPGN